MSPTTMAAAHTPEARAKATATRKRNARLKKRLGIELPLSAVPARAARKRLQPSARGDALVRDLARVLIQLTDTILKGR